MRGKRKSEMTRFLTVSLVLISILTVFIFSFLAIYMNRRSMDTISEVGKIYMSGMSEQVSLHFATTIDLRLSQVEALVETHRPDRASEKLMEDLIYSAQARGFEYLALYSDDGDFQMLCGSELEVTDPEPLDRKSVV